MRTERAAAMVLGLAFVLSGCATGALWKNPAFDGFNEPASPVNLQLFKISGDVLVQYDEVRERDDHVCRRAYYLNSSTNAIARGRMPRFVGSSLTPQLLSVPVYVRDSTAAGSFRSNEMCATLSANGQEFTLYAGAENLGHYDLPTYPAPSGRVKQVLLTPWTVAADLTIVGGYLGLWWLRCGAPGVDHY